MSKNMRHNKKRNKFSIVFPILTIIVFGLLLAFSAFYEKSWSYNWSDISEQVRDSVILAETGGISNGGVGFSNRKPKQYDRRHWIMKNASKNELLKLTEYPNITIKAIAYEGLIRKKDFENKTDLIIESFNERHNPIDYQMGCVAMPMYLSEYLVEFVLCLNDSIPIIPEGQRNRFRFAEHEVEKILTEYRKHGKYWE